MWLEIAIGNGEQSEGMCSRRNSVTPNKRSVTGSLNPVRTSVAQVHGLSVSDRSDADPLRSWTLLPAFGFGYVTDIW